MIGSDPRAAFDAYSQQMQRALHCVTQAKIRRSLVHRGMRGAFAFDADETIRLSRVDNRRQVFFGLTQRFQIVEAEGEAGRMFRILIEDYEYKIFDSRRRELFVFHWHPASVSEATWPHVHVGSVAVDAAAEGMEDGFYERFSRLHVPTRMLAVEQVARFLITEMPVTPLRADWDVVLQEGEALFQRHQLWLLARNT